MINVIGLGYIGLPTALMFASHGCEVVGTDYNPQLIATLNAGHASFEEKGLDELFGEALRCGIRFSTEYQKTNMYIVAVPTPYDKDSKKIDASYVVNAVRSVMEVCPKGAIVVIESTISPGTIDKFVRPVVEEAGFVIGQDLQTNRLVAFLYTAGCSAVNITASSSTPFTPSSGDPEYGLDAATLKKTVRWKGTITITYVTA